VEVTHLKSGEKLKRGRKKVQQEEKAEFPGKQRSTETYSRAVWGNPTNAGCTRHHRKQQKGTSCGGINARVKEKRFPIKGTTFRAKPREKRRGDFGWRPCLGRGKGNDL